MGIRFGSLTGRRERIDYRIDEGELQCGKNIYSYLKTIEKSTSIDDEFFTCSMGIVLDPVDSTIGSPDCTDCPSICIEEITVTIREEAIPPRYKPKDVYSLNEILEYSEDGSSVLDLGCPIKIRRTEIEVTARYKSDGTTNLPLEAILRCKTSDELLNVVDIMGFNPIPYVRSWTVRTKSIDKPVDDFWTQEISYLGRIGYPSDVTIGNSNLRDTYVDGILTDLGITRDDTSWPVPEGVVNMKRSTIEYTLTMRFDSNPTRRITITTYALPSIST